MTIYICVFVAFTFIIIIFLVEDFLVAFIINMRYIMMQRWTKMSILNTAGSYKFSSDRTIHEYARDIWRIEPVVLP